MALDGVIKRLDRLLILLTGFLIGAATVGVAVLPGDTATPLTVPRLGPATAPTSSGVVDTEPVRKGPGQRPVRLQIPSIDMSAEVVRIEVTPDGVLNPPDDLALVGWWRQSARAGAAQGQTVLTGHSASSVAGVMDDLPDVVEGAKVSIRTPKGRINYEVTGSVELNHRQLADQAQDLFGQDRPDNRLVMVTCSDYRNGVWNKNTIVFAEPV